MQNDVCFCIVIITIIIAATHALICVPICFQYGAYGGHHDRRRNVALIVDCYVIDDSVTVRVFDQSRGNINRVTGAYAAVKMCSFGSQALAA